MKITVNYHRLSKTNYERRVLVLSWFFSRLTFIKSVTVKQSNINRRVPRDFRLQVFYINQFPQTPDYTIRVASNFFRKFAEIFAALGAPHWHRWQMKIRNDPIVIFRGLGEDDSWKKSEAKISCHCPFNLSICPIFSAAPRTRHSVATMRSALASFSSRLPSKLAPPPLVPGLWKGNRLIKPEKTAKNNEHSTAS